MTIIAGTSPAASDTRNHTRRIVVRFAGRLMIERSGAALMRAATDRIAARSEER